MAFLILSIALSALPCTLGLRPRATQRECVYALQVRGRPIGRCQRRRASSESREMALGRDSARDYQRGTCVLMCVYVHACLESGL